MSDEVVSDEESQRQMEWLARVEADADAEGFRRRTEETSFQAMRELPTEELVRSVNVVMRRTGQVLTADHYRDELQRRETEAYAQRLDQLTVRLLAFTWVIISLTAVLVALEIKALLGVDPNARVGIPGLTIILLLLAVTVYTRLVLRYDGDRERLAPGWQEPTSPRRWWRRVRGGRGMTDGEQTTTSPERPVELDTIYSGERLADFFALKDADLKATRAADARR